MYTYKYPRPSVAADCVVFAWDGKQIQILLIQRKSDPFKGFWAIPGGFVEENETCDQGATRELYEETGLKISEVELVNVYSEPKRDPRQRVISNCYFTIIKKPKGEIQGADDAEKADWFPIDKTPELAFDHATILSDAISAIRKKALHYPIGINIFPEEFTGNQIATFYARIFTSSISESLITDELFSHKLIRETSNGQFSFNKEQYYKLQKTGYFLKIYEEK